MIEISGKNLGLDLDSVMDDDAAQGDKSLLLEGPRIKRNDFFIFR